MTANNTNNEEFTFQNGVDEKDTTTVTFEYGVAKNAKLIIPTVASSIATLVGLINKSLVKYKLEQGGLFSDQVIYSSIGTSHFIKGALLGWQDRLEVDQFKALERNFDDSSLLVDRLTAIAEHRYGLTGNAVYEKVLEFDFITDEQREFFSVMLNVNTGDLGL